MEIIDFHTHAFPGRLAARAMDSLSAESGGLIPCADGTVGGLLSLMDADGVDRSAVLNIATNPKQMKSVNDFAIGLLTDPVHGGRLIPFGSVWPTAEDARDELYRLREAGVRGVKFHPEYQDFYVDDDAMAPVYETIRKLRMITVFHAGADIGFPVPVRAAPARCAAMLPAFGEAPVVLAHMGGYMLWYEVLEHLAGRDVYLDTSYCYSRIPLPLMKEIVSKHGAQRVLFGSDAPWTRPYHERRLVEALGLDEEDFADVMGGNARRLLGNEGE